MQKEDFVNAVDRIIGGLEKKNKVTTADERRTIAIHEAAGVPFLNKIDTG